MTAHDTPHCFGSARHWNGKACTDCIYKDACRFYIDNPPPKEWERDSTGHFVSYDRMAHDKRIADGGEYPDAPPDLDAVDYDAPRFSCADLEKVLSFLDSGIDDYTLAIIIRMIRGTRDTTAGLARDFNVSREAMNRKIYHACKKYPYLYKMFTGCLPKCGRLKAYARQRPEESA